MGCLPHGKATESVFITKKVVSTLKPLELLLVDLFVPSRTRSLGAKYYRFVIVYDYSIFTWTLFLAHKEETLKAFVKFSKLVQNIFNLKVATLRSDHGGEFINHQFENFCNENEITHNFSCHITPQQNGVVGLKNCILEELA